MIKRVAVCGQKNIAIECTKILLTKNIEVVFVTPNISDKGIDSWQLSFRKWANTNNIRIVEADHENLKKNILESKIDLLFSIYYDKILKKDLLNLLPHGVVNTHLSALPRYRGIAPVTFALINGETAHGVSLHYIDEGIDRGDVISQKFFNIENMNANEAFLKATDECIKLFEESVDSILDGTNNRIKQDNSKALYYSNKTINWSTDHKIIDNALFFNKDTRSLFNWFRGFIFPPMQNPQITIENVEYEILSVKPIYENNSFEKPGTVIYISSAQDQFSDNQLKEVKLSTHDSYIVLKLRQIAATSNE